MSTGTLIYIISMGFTVCIFGGITYLLKQSGDYSLINGFSNRPDEEKEYLKQSGYLDAITTVFQHSFWILLITFIGGLFPIPYVFGIGMVLFLLYLLIGLVWVQRFEVPKKRNKMTWIMASFTIVMIVFVGTIFVIGFLDNEVTVTENNITISGMYGDEWHRSDISEVKMMDEVPEILSKKDGFAMTNILKGRFKLEEPFGNSILFIQKRSEPVLYIQVDEEHIFINKKDHQDTKVIFEALEEN